MSRHRLIRGKYMIVVFRGGSRNFQGEGGVMSAKKERYTPPPRLKFIPCYGARE